MQSTIHYVICSDFLPGSVEHVLMMTVLSVNTIRDVSPFSEQSGGSVPVLMVAKYVAVSCSKQFCSSIVAENKANISTRTKRLLKRHRLHAVEHKISPFR